MCNQNEDYESKKHYAGYMESVDEKEWRNIFVTHNAFGRFSQ